MLQLLATSFEDNLKPGLTIIFPLTEVNEELGPTQLLPGSHLGPMSGFKALAASQGAVAAPLMPGQERYEMSKELRERR